MPFAAGYPACGGGVASLICDGRQLIADGRVGNELALYEEYPSHPTQGEGPWHLLPKGPVRCSSESPAEVRARAAKAEGGAMTVIRFGVPRQE